MSDIALRFGKDMLVLSASLDARLRRQGFDPARDAGYVALFESDSVQDALRMDMLAGATCVVANSAAATPARMAQLSMEANASEFAEASLAAVCELRPQHVLVEIGPCGLPLDPESKASLNENRDQYARAARLFEGKQFDAFFLNGFTTCDDLKCALMGLRQVSDSVVFASVEVGADGVLASGRGTVEEAFSVMAEYGAAVAGFNTRACADDAALLAARGQKVCSLPLLVQLEVAAHNPKQGASTSDNPYYCPDVMVSAASVLRAAHVQFLRATGDVTPAYTGALVAAVSGFDVIPFAKGGEDVAGAGGSAAGGADLEGEADVAADAAADGFASLMASARQEVNVALGKGRERGASI